MILVDYHIHTSWSDGNQSVQQVIDRNKELNLDAIAITDHARKNSHLILDYISLLKKYQKNISNPLIIFGIEVKIMDHEGNIDFNLKWINNIDIILLAIHNINKISNKNKLKIKKNLPYLYGELLISTIKNVQFPIPTIIAHPGKLLNENNLPFISHEYWDEIAKHTRKNKKIIEYNTSSPPPRGFIIVLKSEGVRLSVGSDAYYIRDIIKGITSAILFLGTSMITPRELLGI